MLRLLLVALSLASTAFAGEIAPASSAAPAPVPLFNGRDLQGWYSFLEKIGRDQDPHGMQSEGAEVFYRKVELTPFPR